MTPDLTPLKGRKKRPQGLEIDGVARGVPLLDDGCKGVLVAGLTTLIDTNAAQRPAALVAPFGSVEKPTNVA